MDINGIVVFASEIISLGDEEGLLLTVFNSAMDIHFCILVHGISIDSWRNVRVNNYYQITNLKVGVLETRSGSKKFVFKTTVTSFFNQVESHLVQKFCIADNLKIFLSLPALSFSIDTEDNSHSNVISYQGIVTKIHDKDDGVYELDGKIILYTTFNSLSSSNITIGSKLFVSNVHLLKNSKKNILLSCGLSSVRNVSENRAKEGITTLQNANFCMRYSLSIYDYLWFERLSFRLKMKFSTMVIGEDISLKRNTELFNTILEFFLCIENEPCLKNNISLVDEYFSNPHTCSAFTKNKLPVDCDVPYFSDILKEAVENISWISISKNWKISINNQNDMILIGMLSLSPNGHFYISDSTEKLHVVWSENCSHCSHHNIFKKFENPEYACIVVICEYDIIFENIFCKSRGWRCLQYIRTSFCRLQPLGSFAITKVQDLSNHFLYKRVNDFDHVEKVNNVLNDIMDFTLSMTVKSTRPSHQRFLVINKMWTIQKSSSNCSRALVLLIPEENCSVDSSVLESNNVFEDSLNFYETNDDFEFANLVTKLDNLSIENNPRLGHLCFKSAQHCNFLHPGHIYIADIESVIRKEKSSFFQSDVEVFSLMTPPDLEIVHDQNCSSIYNSDKTKSVKYISVKEIALNRRILAGYIIRGVLIDKFYEDNNDRIPKSTLIAKICMKIKDIVSNDSIPVYVPYIPESVVGMLPGTILELYGFICICSQKGNLYLKASSTFGIEILSNQKLTHSDESKLLDSNSQEIFAKKEAENHSVLTPFRHMCFLVKIMSAEVFTMCTECHKKFKEYCSCPVFSKANIKCSD